MGSFNWLPLLGSYSSLTNRRSLHPIFKWHTSPRATTRPLLHYPFYSRSKSWGLNEPSPESLIRHDLTLLPIDKWGWVIYRCTYADDKAWSRFRDIVETQTRKGIAESDAPEIADSLEWTWVEDPATLDGISTPALRERFRTWATNEVARQQLEKHDPCTIPRFSYFIKIDEEVMQNLDEFLYSENVPYDTGFVKLVDANWIPEKEYYAKEDLEGFSEEEWRPDEYDEIEGCTEKNVGWMRILPAMVDTYFYEMLNGDSMNWGLYYYRPPEIARL